MAKIERMNSDIELKDIWKRPNYKKMKDSGIPIEVVAKIKMIRDAIPPRPTFTTPQTYYDVTVFIKKTTDEVREFEDFRNFRLTWHSIQSVGFTMISPKWNQPWKQTFTL